MSLTIINGTSADDLLQGTSGNDEFYGFAGDDVVSLGLPLAFATFSLDERGRWVVSGSQGRDVLDSVERAQFLDLRVSLAGPGEQFRVDVQVTGGAGLSPPSVAPLAGGGWIAAYEAAGISTQRYSATGAALEWKPLSVDGGAYAPVVAGLAGGGWMVAWEYSRPIGAGGDPDGITARVYDSGGQMLSDLQVNVSRDGVQSDPAITVLRGGLAVVSWSSAGRDGRGIYAQVVDATGAKVGSEAMITAPGAYYVGQPATAALSDGGCIFVWTDGTQSGSNVHAQRFDASGGRVGVETTVNATTGPYQDQPAVTGLPDGGYVVAWRTQVSGGHDVLAQRFDAAGGRVGDPVRVNDVPGTDPVAPAVAALTGGGYVMTWTASTPQTARDVYAQVYDSGGQRLGGPALVNSLTSYDQKSSAVAGLADGGYVVAWDSQALNSSGVYARLFDADGAARGLPAIAAEDWRDTTIRMSPSTQGVHLTGGRGKDFLQGTNGSDVLDGAWSADRTIYPGTHDQYSVHAVPYGHVIDGAAAGEGVDTVLRIERVLFSDEKLALDLQGTAGMVARDIGALFGPAALQDKGLVGQALALADSGWSNAQLLDLGLTIVLGPAPRSSDVVRLLYGNVVGAEPDAATLASFAAMMDTGAVTPAGLADYASSTVENAVRIDLAGLADSGLAYL